ncbi:carbohydrate-binding module family 50 protein [Trichocladium antarcticum]|uniref:Carbohydrate-binding module family 50 protein n=1 Tax=Trichocladium antarcticum TaxID=1450529 RepID=A0AAN6UR90_9PEZI|nr:carbohydrate-binding module family 50 protein [Trichocladium antarcticum]
MLPSAPTLVLASGLIAAVAAGRSARVLKARDGPSPSLPHDPNTSSYCSWWVDINSATSCDALIAENWITMADLRRWNPSLPATCALEVGKSYCVEAQGEPATEPSTTSTTPAASSTSSTSTTPAASTTSASSTVAPPVTTTAPGNGITTPTPTQATLVDNCDAFHLVTAGETCEAIASHYQISLDQFKAWNPSVGASCAGLWADAYACVSIIGHEPSPTAPGNGIATPTPTQAAIVDNCDKFYFVVAGDTCDAIAAKHALTPAQFLAWNPSVGAACTGLWANAYACVSIIGHTPTTPTPTPSTSTTSAGNGIATPTPTQANMVKNCDLFHKVKSGDTCATIAAAKGITVAQLTAWNPDVKPDCSMLWQDYHICISIVGHTPTPVNPGNGIQTPTPHQGGMTGSCKTFHFVQAGQTCQTITARYKISQANFVKWNPAVKNDCSGMWANAYVCVAVL